MYVQVQRYWRGLLGPGRESPCLGCCPQPVAINLLMSKANYPSRKLEAKFPYLISFIPPNILHFGKCLGAFHHKINEVATPAQAAYDEDIGQNPQEPPQMDILILVAFLLIYYRLLKKQECLRNLNGYLAAPSIRQHHEVVHPMKCNLLLFWLYPTW